MSSRGCPQRTKVPTPRWTAYDAKAGISRLQLHELPIRPERPSNDKSQDSARSPSPVREDFPHGLTSVLPFGSMRDSLVRGSVLRLRRCLPDFFYCFFLGWATSTRSVSDRQVKLSLRLSNVA